MATALARLASVTLALVLCACATHPWHKSTRRAAQHAWSKRTYALGRSFYLAQLYDDNERWMLQERPSGQTSHRHGLRRALRHPPPEVGIVPAGTPVVLEHIDFPTRTAMLHRMLSTPVHNVWLRVRPAPGAVRTGAPLDDKPWILVLGDEVRDDPSLSRAIERWLSPPAEVAAYLGEQPPAVRAAIAHKAVVLGMEEKALLMALGEPVRWQVIAGPHGEPGRLAIYPDRQIVLFAQKVTDVLDGRPKAAGTL